MELGPTPVDEKAAQVKVHDDFDVQNELECKVFKAQLERTFPGTEFRVKSFEHEFGYYREVCVYFDDEDEDSSVRAYQAEAGLPNYWDDQAVIELHAAGYRHIG